MNEIVKMVGGAVADSVRKSDRAAVMLSGGIDSTIILHHLVDMEVPVETFTASFSCERDEVSAAKRVAAHYGVRNTVVDVTGVFLRMDEIMAGLDMPRFNVWPYPVIETAASSGANCLFIGEGSDEHFGGYVSKSYLEGWADHIRFILPLYRQFCDRFKLRMEAPFTRILWVDTRRYHENPNKAHLRQAYSGILPEWAVNSRKGSPAFTDYANVWEKSLKTLFPETKTRPTAEGIRRAMIMRAAESWINANPNL